MLFHFAEAHVTPHNPLRKRNLFRRMGLFRRSPPVIAGRDPATQAATAACAALDHRVKPGDDSKRARCMGSFRRIPRTRPRHRRFMGLFRRIPRTGSHRPRFMGLFRRIPRTGRRRPRFMGLFRRIP